jgi:uncharacterized protein YkwD
MVSSPSAPRRRRLASLVLALATVALIAAPGAATASNPTVDAATLTAQEAAMVKALNADRTALGLVPVRVDQRLMAIARARSDDMVANDYFSHEGSDGRNVFDILSDQHVTWYGAGEIIAWNTYPMDSTTAAANRQWMNSAGHRAIVVSKSYNYVGVGLAVDAASGKKLWTAVFLKGPDRTSARASVSRSLGSWDTSRTRYVTISWSGYDVRLQVLTSGLRSFVLQRSKDGGPWESILSSTTLRKKTMRMWIGHTYTFRVAARDNAGNPLNWVTTTVDLR